MKFTRIFIVTVFLMMIACSSETDRVPSPNTQAPTPTASPSPTNTPRAPHPDSTAENLKL